MFESATFKLTMWYLAIVIVISLGFSVVVYHLASSELGVGLQHQTQRIFDEFPVFSGNPRLIQRPDNDIAFGQHHILLQLLYFNILVLICAGIASYFLARRTLRPIEEAHKRQKRFTADVSHELRTPLTSLRMGSEVALMDQAAGKAELREALESNLEDAAKMEQLINSLLRLTKLDAEQAMETYIPIDLRDVVEEAQSQVQKQAAAKRIDIVGDTAKLQVNGDHATLVQLLVILLDNAIKYSPGKSSITLQTKKRGREALISVQDHGQGIAKDALPHVFDRFYREDKARTQSNTEGFGLGLSIAKLIADKHHGSITLTSRPGNGTTATVVLPLITTTTASGK